jgi:hypothetical protein
MTVIRKISGSRRYFFAALIMKKAVRGGPKFLPPAINQPRDNIHPPSDRPMRPRQRPLRQSPASGLRSTAGREDTRKWVQ